MTAQAGSAASHSEALQRFEFAICRCSAAERWYTTRIPDETSLNIADRTQLRAEMRAKRNALPLKARNSASAAITRHLLRTRAFTPGTRIAAYIAFDGEIDVGAFIFAARQRGCVLYAPQITNMRARKMDFFTVPTRKRAAKRQLQPRTAPQRGRLHREGRIGPRSLDIVLVPLVAFDRHGWRLGYGAGFYDRKFAFKRRFGKRNPLLIGVAYEFQRVPTQKANSWDVPLDAVVTELGLRSCRSRRPNLFPLPHRPLANSPL